MEHFPVKGLVRMGRAGYSSDRLEFDVFLRDFQRKKVNAQKSKVTSRRVNESIDRGNIEIIKA